jgi:hypothetical protein
MAEEKNFMKIEEKDELLLLSKTPLFLLKSPSGIPRFSLPEWTTEKPIVPRVGPIFPPLPPLPSSAEWLAEFAEKEATRTAELTKFTGIDDYQKSTPFDKPFDKTPQIGTNASCMMPLSSFLIYGTHESSMEYEKEPEIEECTCMKIYNWYMPSPCECTDYMKKRNKCCVSCYITQTRSCHRNCPANGGSGNIPIYF